MFSGRGGQEGGAGRVSARNLGGGGGGKYFFFGAEIPTKLRPEMAIKMGPVLGAGGFKEAKALFCRKTEISSGHLLWAILFGNLDTVGSLPGNQDARCRMNGRVDILEILETPEIKDPAVREKPCFSIPQLFVSRWALFVAHTLRSHKPGLT